MMKKKGWMIHFTLSFVLIGAFLLISNEKMNAADGGEAPTQGEIILFDDDSSNDSKPSETSDSREVPKTSGGATNTPDAPTPTKPKGRLPSTGDLVKAGISVGGLALIATVFIFFLIKKRKTAHENGGEGE
ncbi:LPXTG cell wall anchor domain-containing protein [Enterococcus ureasiticus]|uniref:Gram-positive cocci surface proteins LPxTG domain-containing protein n=1 Tax=Enterococcus ureasiticus TaxID=903984 RepID=A0A1E5GAK5_9ENTE|nr:LPXTG cell wall anchor domain-containing protein [Enterococcus ureasiticus]OEG09723.1 hypothetical protein BCR21_15400 [Enterococcus ureasiticus]